MPIFPKEEDGQITLTLKSGDTVTLIEKPISVGERKAITRRALQLSHEVGYKQKRVKEIEDTVKNNGIQGDERTKLESESEELLSSLDAYEIHAEALSRRFTSWDFFTTKEDFENKRPLQMTKEAILEACAQPWVARIIQEITELLLKHDGVEEKKEPSEHADTGSSSTATPH